jgi:GR25 family glycosyltransferase involved in LPS biosynthesis
MIETNFIIGMSNNEISKKYMEITIPEIKRVTFQDVNIWEATIPETLPDGPLQFIKTKPTKGTPFSKDLSSTEKSVWYSHYRLWKHIYENKLNSWVFEHDVDLSCIDILLIANEKKFITAKDFGCLECYYITHEAAKILIDYSESEKIYYQIDGFVNYLMRYRFNLKNISTTKKLKISQLTMFGNTIDHQPSSAT